MTANPTEPLGDNVSSARRRLAARYRRLLLNYPRGYRRERGEEIVQLLLDLAPAQRRRPTLKETANLIRHGQRCRLGRPASRAVVGWAGLTAVVCGLFCAAFATRVGWESARPLPSTAEASAIFASVLPDRAPSQVDRSPAMFVLYGQPLGPSNIGSLLDGDGAEYDLGSVDAASNGGPPIDQQHITGTAARLRADHWTVSDPVTRNMVECGGASCVPAGLPTEVILTAHRGADILEIDFYPDQSTSGWVPGPWESPTVIGLSMHLGRATPWAVYPAGIAGGLLGALAGWLTFGWASRRTEQQHPLRQASAVTVYGLVMFLWCVPMLWGAPATLDAVQRDSSSRWPPLWVWLGQPTATLPFLAGCALALVGLAVAALPRRPYLVTGAP